ncbi:MAG: hypothetical protein M1153_00970 [Patescibacteria group bacterium]|nr:hypothetical protein [Patescibacteria group bacterium]
MSLLIRNVQIMDGRGGKPYKADLLVQLNKISAIGNLRGKSASNYLNGLGNYLLPGFIDPAAVPDRHLDLLLDPGQTCSRKEGITTVVGGSGGVSLAPLIYGRLDALAKWAEGLSVNTDWRTFADFLKSLDRLKPGINFGSFVGYETIKEAITGGESRELTRNEAKVIQKVIDRGLREGAFGVSFSSACANYPKTELKGVLAQVSRHRGVVSLSLDVKKGRDEALKAIGAVNGRGKMKILVTDFFPVVGYESVFEDVVSSLTDKENIKFVLKTSPYVLYEALDILPEWLTNGREREAAASALKDAEIAAKIEPELSWLRPEKTIVVSARTHGVLNGKTLGEISEMYDLPPGKALLKTLTACKLRVTLVYPSLNEETLLKHLSEKNILLSSYGYSSLLGEAGKSVERDCFVNHLKSAALLGEEALSGAVRQITSAPAKFLNLADRGAIKEGYAADLLLVDKDNFRVIESVVGGITGQGVALHHQG